MDFLKSFSGDHDGASDDSRDEALLGKETGAQKKAAAGETVSAAMNITDAVTITMKQMADSAKFTEGLSAIVDGVMRRLNASISAKQ
jgi:hypothetical protein